MDCIAPTLNGAPLFLLQQRAGTPPLGADGDNTLRQTGNSNRGTVGNGCAIAQLTAFVTPPTKDGAGVGKEAGMVHTSSQRERALLEAGKRHGNRSR